MASKPTPEKLAKKVQQLERMDITERAHTPLEFNAQRDLLSAVFENAPFAMLLINEAEQVVNINRAAKTLIGRTREESLNRPCGEVLVCRNAFYGDGCGRNPACTRCPIRTPMLHTLLTGEPAFEQEGQMTFLSGAEPRLHYLLISTLRLESPHGRMVLVTFSDITNRKQMEKDLLKSRERYNSFIANSHEAIYCTEFDEPIDPSLPIEQQIDEIYRNAFMGECNQAMAAMYGLPSADDLIGRRLVDFHGGANNPSNRQAFKKFIESNYRSVNAETEEVAPDGTRHFFLNNDIGILKEGYLVRIWGTAIDVTDRKQAESERRQLMSAIEQVTEVVMITDPNGLIQYVNPAFERTTGYTRRDAIGKTPRFLKSGVQDRIFYQTLWDSITAGKTWKGRMVNRHKTGTLYTEEISISPVLDTNGGVVNYVGVKRDITKEIDLEKRLAHSQRIEAVGVLAGGIAHDFNNILFPIVGMAELLLDDLPPGSLEYENARQILEAGKRGRDLIKQILSFSRQSENRKIPIRIQQILKEVLTLVRATVPATVTIHSDIQSDCGLVMADPTQLHQVAMNIITNAYHAVEDVGGTISVGLTETELGRDATADTLLKPGRYALLTVSDDGHGIGPSVITRVFEPYFTTKAQGKGTGLGLSVAHGIVKKHGGTIRVYSDVGSGSTFTVYFPLLKGIAKPETSDQPMVVETGTESILLVDDEEPIVLLEQMMLERLGYRVTPHTDSMAALATFRSSPDRFDLVITDMNMPNMTGDQLAETVRSIKPDVPIIVCTGFSDRLDERSASAKGINGFLMKPVVKSALAQMVRKVLTAEKG